MVMTSTPRFFSETGQRKNSLLDACKPFDVYKQDEGVAE